MDVQMKRIEACVFFFFPSSVYFVLLSGSNFFFKCLIISFVSLPFVFDLSVVFFCLFVGYFA
jgi:hypothetical protein